MIKIKVLDGPHAEKVREISPRIDALILLEEIYFYGWHWEIDYSLASGEERFTWGRADIVVRAVRALREGRTVYFLGKEYRGLSTVGNLEDAIVASGRVIRLGFDNEGGLQIVAPGIER